MTTVMKTWQKMNLCRMYLDLLITGSKQENGGKNLLSHIHDLHEMLHWEVSRCNRAVDIIAMY